MFEIEVSDDVMDYARRLVTGHNFGKRGVADGNAEQQVVGLVGQTVLHDLFGVPRPCASEGPDRGVDFMFAGLSVDVKTMGRNVPARLNYVNNFTGLQRHYQTDVLLFCSFDKLNRILTVCGWITKQTFFQRAACFPAGTVRTRGDGTVFETRADLYEIRNSELHRPKSTVDLKNALSRLAEGQARQKESRAA